MKLKTVTIEGKTYAEVSTDGRPLYDDDGKEVAFDAPGTVATIARLNGEAKTHREAKEAAETKLKTFEGITDPTAAIKALETVKNLDDKKLVDAGEVEKVKAAAIASVEEKYKPVTEENARLKTNLNEALIGGAFSRSKFIGDKVAVPADIVQARFGTNFKLEDGKVVAYDQSGNKLYSKAKPGEPAEFEEALELLIEAYPYKDQILKGDGSTGSGKQPPSNTNNPGGKVMKRAEFDKLDGMTQSQKMSEGFTLVD